MIFQHREIMASCIVWWLDMCLPSLFLDWSARRHLCLQHTFLLVLGGATAPTKSSPRHALCDCHRLQDFRVLKPKCRRRHTQRKNWVWSKFKHNIPHTAPKEVAELPLLCCAAAANAVKAPNIIVRFDLYCSTNDHNITPIKNSDLLRCCSIVESCSSYPRIPQPQSISDQLSQVSLLQSNIV